MQPQASLVAIFGLAAISMACSAPSVSDGDHHDYGEPENVGEVTSRLEATDPVSMVVDDGCGTAPLMPLSTQLVEEIECLSPGALVSFQEQLGDGIEAGGSVFPFLQSVAVDSLQKVIAARGAVLHLNSGLRTLPQQFVLYRWYQLGRCGITLAATPGTSNHESGLAVDVQDNAGWRPFFLDEGWHWQGANDPVHYDIQGGVDLKGLSILAFQRMWNRNHPEDLIEEDGVYGDITEARLTKSPIGGFPIGAVCNAEPGGGQGGGGMGGSAAGSAGSTAGGSAAGGAISGGSAGAGDTGGSGPGVAGSGGAASTAGSSGIESQAGTGAGAPRSAAQSSDSGSCSVGAAGRPRTAFWLVLALAGLALWRRDRGARRLVALMSATLSLAGCSSSDDVGPSLSPSAGAGGFDVGMAGSVAVSGAAGSSVSSSGGMSGSSGMGGAGVAGASGSATTPMVPDQCLMATAPCESDGQCCDGWLCDMTSLGQVCCGNEGVSCATENGEDCCGDLLCIDGMCASPFLEPLPCESPCKAAPALTLERSRLEDVIGGSWLGICGDANHTYGYHVPAANLPADDYSLEGEDNEPVCEWYASAIDIGMDWPASRDWLHWLIEGIQTGRLQGIGEVIGSYDGENVRYWSDSRGWSTEGVPYTGSGHDTWTHVSIHRSTALVDHRILAGWTATGPEAP
jgi:MYXO-CTERM domain-containing protein